MEQYLAARLEVENAVPSNGLLFPIVAFASIGSAIVFYLFMTYPFS
jgi:hypothetical protein